MSIHLDHKRALQFSGALALVTAALTALPLLASDEFDEPYYAGQIVQIFQKIGASSVGTYSNGSLDTSAFDFASYFNHTCYRPTDFDMPGCKQKFGPYANLKDTYDSGDLALILSKVSYLKDVIVLLPQAYGAKPSSSSSSSSSSSVSSSAASISSSAASEPTPSTNASSSQASDEIADRKDRAAQVWKLCVAKFPERNASVRCYQRNIRLIMERTEPVSENLVY